MTFLGGHNMYIPLRIIDISIVKYSMVNPENKDALI